MLKNSKVDVKQKISAIMVLESLANDTIRMNNTLDRLVKLFGYLPSKSIIVLATKRNVNR